MTISQRTRIAIILRQYAQGLIDKVDAMHQIKQTYFLTN